MRRMIVAAMAAVMVTGCVQAPDEKRAEDAVKAAQEAADAARQAGDAARQAGDAARQAGQAAVDSAQSGAAPAGGSTAPGAGGDLAAVVKGLEALAGGGAAGSGERVEPVRFQDLIALMPEIDGWEMKKPKGERMTAPIATASAEAKYSRGDARVEIEIVDSAFNQLLLAPIAMFLQVGYSQESSSGYEKSLSVNGHPGWEKWNSDRKDGEVNAFVARRFIVSIQGYDIDDPRVLQEIAQKIDFARLAALK